MPFNPDSTAAALLAGYERRQWAETLAEPPSTIEDAYAVQDQVTARLGGVGGWKVGAPSPTAEPVAAPLPTRLIRPSPSVWPAGSFRLIGVEAEIAFLIGRDLPAGTGPLELAQIREAVSSVHVAIEIVDSRLATYPKVDRFWALADNQNNGAFTYDPVGVPLPDRALTNADVRLTIDGEVRLEQAGGNSGGDPVRLLAWLVNHVRSSRGGLREGSVVTTGSYTGLIFIEPGSHCVAEFDGLGRAEARFE